MGVARVFGLFDTHGNVFEWTHDWYGAPEMPLSIDPTGPSRGECRVLHGGSSGGDPPDCRQANRFTYTPSYRTAVSGFRLAMTMPGNPTETKQSGEAKQE
ncbi:MAG: formylglycine-generating enzyme family protein [Planctomycetota bacterium]